MKHFRLDLDEEQADVLIDLLTAAIAEADRDTATPQSDRSIRVISVGSPVLDDLRRFRPKPGQYPDA